MTAGSMATGTQSSIWSNLKIGQEHARLAEHFLRIERESGFTMKHKKSLADILKEPL